MTAQTRVARQPGTVQEAAFVSSDWFCQEAFGRHHPLSIPRHASVLALADMLGWLPESHRHTCSPASESLLAEVHDLAYIRALRRASERGRAEVQERERYGFGTMENPLFPGLFQRAAATVAGSVLAAELALEGQVAFHPAGGTHHGRRDRAAGFCYFNDPAFALLTLLNAPLDRVMYVDLDAHHGDGVQALFSRDPRVFCLSIHEQDRWPYSGAVEDRGHGQARNLPVPPGFNDDELAHLVSVAVLPLLEAFAPQALVITCGADALHGDPLSRMELSNQALWRAVDALRDATPRTVVLGGGGYNPWTVVRCWTGLWGRLAGHDVPAELPPAALKLLGGFECDLVDTEDIEPAWLTSLADEPRPGPVRAAVSGVARAVLEPNP